MTFPDAIKTVIVDRYADFNGRSRRPEYWWFVLFAVLLNAVLQMLSGDSAILSLIALLITLSILIPSIAVAIRRLHDTGRSGWWLLLSLIPLLGFLVLVYFYIQPTDPETNAWGPPPPR